MSRAIAAVCAYSAPNTDITTQVTADGIPVIWHDDLVLSMPHQPNSAPQMHHISKLNLRDFKKLSQHKSSSSSTSGSSSRQEGASSAQSEDTHCSSQSARLTEAAAPQAALEQSSAPAHQSSAVNGQGAARLARFFNSEEGKRQHSAQAWAVSEEDALPTLAEVFKVPHVLPILEYVLVHAFQVFCICCETAMCTNSLT